MVEQEHEKCPRCGTQMYFFNALKVFRYPNCGNHVGAFYFRKTSIESTSLQSQDNPRDAGRGEEDELNEASPARTGPGTSPHSSKSTSLRRDK